MSQSSLGKKLQPAKKAWKRFARTVESKFHNLNLSKAIKVIKTSCSRLLSYCSIRFFHPFKKHSLTRPHYRRYHCNRDFYGHYYSNKNHVHNNFSAIYIDQLYSEEAAGSSTSSLQAKHFHAENNSRDKQVVDEQVLPRKEDKEKEKVLYSIEDAWREIVAKSPQLRPVDERADEFISNFRQEIKLQKEKSILEFEEMLARGT